MIFKQIDELLSNLKTQTRRIAKPNEAVIVAEDDIPFPPHTNILGVQSQSKKGKWRKKWAVGQDYAIKPSMYAPGIKTHRMLITTIRHEPLHNITEQDAIAEGVASLSIFSLNEAYLNYQIGEYSCMTAIDSYKSLWDLINGKNKKTRWDANPNVWVIEFKVIPTAGTGLALSEKGQ